MLDKDSRMPLYSQLIDILIYDIENKMKKNEKMLSEREICDLYDVSRTTVRQAFSELEREGYIYKVHGKGTFVSEKKYKQELKGLYSFTENMKSLGKKPISKVLKFEIINANNEIANKMNLSKETQVYKFTRLRIADDEPMMLETSYVPYDLLPGITKEELSNNALYDIMRNRFNESLEYADEAFIPVLTNEEESKYLDIEIGSPSLKITRISYNKKNRVLEYTISISRGDKFQYQIKLTK